MNNMLNPSSTKPYSITFYLRNATSTQTVSTTLTISSPRTSSFTFDPLSDITTSTSVSTLYFMFQNYISPTTILNITYDNRLVGLGLNSASSYSVINDGIGIKRITGCNADLQELGSVNLNVTNIDFAVKYAITGILYFTSGAV